MIQFIWEFVVKEAAQGQFELTFGPGGAWSNLCARSQGFRGAMLLRDTHNPRRYLVVELWDTQDQRDRMLIERQGDYSQLEASFDDWTVSRTEVGTFRVMADATVRPHGGAPRTRGGEARRRGRGAAH
jgi:hypothetical protein